MKSEKKALLIKYLVCFGIASLIAFIVIWVKGFFTDSTSVNLQITSDAFFVSGILMTLFAGMMFVSGEGALLGIGFILKSVALIFVPMGRNRHELYKDSRERKLAERRDRSFGYILVVGLIYLAVGITFTVIWYSKFYTPMQA